jgi:coenzyme PQQ biosynthesis protein PqqD
MSPASRPVLAPKARLRHDRRRGGWLLLYPERGLALNTTGMEIVRRCTGDYTISRIAAELADGTGAAPETVEREVLAFVEALAARALVRDVA